MGNFSTLTNLAYEYAEITKRHVPTLNTFLANLQTKRESLESSQYAVNPYVFFEKRVKTFDSAIAKYIKGTANAPETISDLYGTILDIYGLRIVVYYLDEIYIVTSYLERYAAKHPDYFKILDMSYTDETRTVYKKDYVKHPKESGYSSLHLAASLWTGSEWITVEIQIRSILMHAWSRLDHLLRYKKDTEISDSTAKILRYSAKLFRVLERLQMYIRDRKKDDHDVTIIENLEKITKTIQEKIEN